MTPGRIFRIVLLATLTLDFVALAVLHLPPATPLVLGLGRGAICVAAAYAGTRGGLSFPRATTAAAGGSVAATLLSMFVFVATGTAAAEGYGPASVVRLLLATLVICVAGGIAGGAAGHLLRKRVRAV
ncbi:MAG TPA: hypothetical protein VF092_07065 [Longimicrobium sp.]